MTTKLLIARHGNTFLPSEEPRRVGLTDLPLVESGLLQGQRLGLYLKQNHSIPDVIITSTLQRTIQTAQAAQEAMQTQLPLQSLPLFDEIDYGPDENQPESQVVARLGEAALKDWDNEAIVPPGWRLDPVAIIQGWLDFAAFIRKTYANQTILVVTSNGIARFAAYLTGDFAAFRKQQAIKVATGGLCVFEALLGEEQWRCQAWNINIKEALYIC